MFYNNIMKKILFYFCILSTMLTACISRKATDDHSHGGEDNANLHELTTLSAEWSDSVVFTKQNMAKVSLKILYATDNALGDSLNAWVCEVFGDSTHTFLKDMPSLTKHFGSKRLKEDSAELKEILSDGAGEWVNYEYDAKMQILYEDSTYITLKCETYQYMAGAHGTTVIDFVTLRRKDGHRMNWDLVKDMPKEEIVKNIKKGLAEYFGIKDINELPEYLLLGNGEDAEAREIFEKDFPLPSTPPYLTANGVEVIYQQYEIAPYAAGMPTAYIKHVK